MSTSVKDLSKMLVHGCSLESPLEHQKEFITPNERFFVCSSGTAPRISAGEYALRIHGDGVRQALTIRYNQLLGMQQRSLPAVLECAGNHRAFFIRVDRKTLRPPSGTADLLWSTGAVGMAEWTGVALRDVLRLAGVKDSALQVCASGSETDSCEGVVRLPMPIDKALDMDTLLALTMNGEPLPVEHGFPVRVLVPGWIGAYSIKWVQDIEVSTKPIWVRRNTTSYVLRGEHWPAGVYQPADGAPITRFNIKSSLALPWPAQLTGGHHTIHGYARSSGSPVASVLWSDDGGRHWRNAVLGEHNDKYGWVRFEFEWHVTAGERVLMTRATDSAGRAQPDAVKFNAGGYLYNGVHPHPVTVS